MSLGVHRLWKKDLLNMMNPSSNQKLIDVACGTGDIAKLFLNNVNKKSYVTCVDPNIGMIKKGKEKLKKFNNLNWVVASAEKLPMDINSFDFYTISFGLRNTKDLNRSLSEAYRVLKPGGRYLCLEFSKIENSGLDFVYKKYSKVIPSIGKLIVGDKEPYEYLVKSIENFVNQDELIDLMKKNGFQNCTYRNLSGGIVSIHSGWKI
jgi:demethylmenaquinone methyltransferase/2-methoxy-6-polyprenyl-1,4-benzoquinol methylase